MSDLLDNTEAAEKAVVDFLTKKSKSKSKFYIKDFYALFPDDKPRAIKKVVNKMVEHEILEFWSSGSTTMYGLKGQGKQAGSEGED
ncbi:dissimilatory sulfite reductase D family protein [Desulfocicer niacini]